DPTRLARGQTALPADVFWTVLGDTEHRRLHRWNGLHLGAVVQDRRQLLPAFPGRRPRNLDLCDRTYFRGLRDLHGRHHSHHATEVSVHHVEFHGRVEEHHRVLPQRAHRCHRRHCSQDPSHLADLIAGPRYHHRGREWSVDDDIVWHGKRALSRRAPARRQHHSDIDVCNADILVLASIGPCSTTNHPVQLHVSSNRGDARANARHGSVASKLRLHHCRRDRRVARDLRPLRPLSTAHSVLALMGCSTLTSIVESNLTIDFPIYGASHRSLRQTLFARTGGLIRHERAGRQQRVVVRALDDVSFTLRSGDRLGLIGHNGAGKSTLLKVLAGVYTPDAGSLSIDGRVSPLFNSAPGLDADDNGYENIKTCGMFLGMSS